MAGSGYRQRVVHTPRSLGLSISAPELPAGLAPRLAAAERLAEVLGGARFSPFGAGEIADPRDRALANRLVTTALRRQGHLSAVLGELLARGLPPRAGRFEAILRLGLAQLLYLPDIGDHSAIFLAVESVKRDRRAAHLAKLANGVLRRAQARAEEFRRLPTDLLLPETLRARWADDYGAAAVEGFGRALLEGAPLDLTLKQPDPALVEALNGAPMLPDAVRIGERDRPVEELPGYAEGRWWVQDVAASLPARLLALPAGARVLDFCAAPGGKTAQLANASYRVTAVDSDAVRLKRLRANLGRLALSADVVEADAADYRPAEPVDAVLLDAPCSATGTFRRHPEVIWRRDLADLGGRVELQRKLLANAAACLRPGGVLVYCVCSLEPEEGERQAEWALAHLAGLESWPIAPAELGAFGFAVTGSGAVRTHPAMPVPPPAAGTLDGFFVARFRRA